MDKNAIKKYATWARTELITRVTQRAEKYGISADADPNADTVRDIVLTATEKKQRAALIGKVKEEGFDQVMEEVAYTWFNRFSALRFMEVNNYLPSRVRVFTDDNNEFKPQILTEAIHMELEGLDMEKAYAFKESNNDEELYKYLLITQCNALSATLPRMFQKIADYTELLFPDNLLREGSVVQQMIELIPEEDWKDQVQILGWLYQYYIAEPKDMLINAHKQYGIKDIPFVTQLFTSDWIVRFIVENSLGRLWLDGHPNDPVKNNWKYYVDEDVTVPAQAEQKAKLLHPEELRCIDPCAGSGHIIAYAFDVLMKLYLSYGYTNHEAVESIVKNNIFGLDIDERAIQIAYFAIMMKACEYDKRFLKRGIQPNVYVIAQGNDISTDTINYFCNKDQTLSLYIRKLINETNNASIYGSLIEINGIDFQALYKRIEEIRSENTLFSSSTINEILPLLHSSELLSKTYAVVFTNPPYMAAKYMPNSLKSYIGSKYPDYKSDLFASFIVRCNEMCEPYGHLGFLSPYVWMFIQSYEKLRRYIFQHMTFSSLVQLEYNAFEAACVPVSAFTFRNYQCDAPFGCIKLSDFRGIEVQSPKTLEAINNRNCGYRYLANQNNFKKIPGSPIAYWVSNKVIQAFDKGVSIDSLSDFTGSQNITANNSAYLRMFWEIDFNDIGKNLHWAYYAKGGEYRKWFGNIQLVVDISPEAIRYYKECPTANYLNEKYWFREGITYSAITSSGTGFRYYEPVGGFDKGGATICGLGDNLYYVLGFLNSCIAEFILQVMNPTINLQVKDVKSLPIIIDKKEKQTIDKLVKENIKISKQDWDSFEVSYGFAKNPLVRKVTSISDAFSDWEKECKNRFDSLKDNEETINKIFLDIYGINGELTPEVGEDKITVRKADLSRDIRCFISYAVGCIFGRYSLDKDGIQHVDGILNEQNDHGFKIDKDGILPICDDEYFEDDIVGYFIRFVEYIYGKDTLEENLQFIAKALGGKGTSREIIRQYFLNDFFKDHCAQYAVTGSGKRPIYWLFDSGKKNGFKCLVYIHRYRADTLARIRTDYVHEQQARYRTAIAGMERQMINATTAEHVHINNQLKKLRDQAEETRIYEEKIHHLADQMIKIDLNDGIVNNYAIFQDVLAKIR